MKQDIKDAFELLDCDETGSIETKELRYAMLALGFEPSKEELVRIIAEVDKDHTGTVNLDEFTKLMSVMIAARDPKEEIAKAFKLFDDDDTGTISFRNLKRVAKELGEDINDEELQEMIEEADRDGDGEVNFDDFMKVMKKANLY
ncbi:hypothetical protein R5R35_005261 [Gryllus longicercus]